MSGLIKCKHVAHVQLVIVLDEKVNNDSLQECSTCCMGLYSMHIHARGVLGLHVTFSVK